MISSNNLLLQCAVTVQYGHGIRWLTIRDTLSVLAIERPVVERTDETVALDLTTDGQVGTQMRTVQIDGKHLVTRLGAEECHLDATYGPLDHLTTPQFSRITHLEPSVRVDWWEVTDALATSSFSLLLRCFHVDDAMQRCKQ